MFSHFPEVMVHSGVLEPLDEFTGCIAVSCVLFWSALQPIQAVTVLQVPAVGQLTAWKLRFRDGPRSVVEIQRRRSGAGPLNTWLCPNEKKSSKI